MKLNLSARAVAGLVACGLVLVAAPVLAAQKVWETDGAHTMLGFRAGTFLFDVPGRFETFSIDVNGDPDKGAASRLRVEIDAASISTGIAKRDEHLRSKDFFDVAHFPKIIFDGKKVTRNGTRVTVLGTLEMHGVKKPLSITFDSTTAVNGAGYSETVYKASIPLSNKDFGLGAQSVAAKISLKDEVTLDLVVAGFWNDPAAKKM